MNTGSPTVSVLIVSYNTREMTLACIASVLDQPGAASCQVVVIDNNSSDGSADAIGKNFPDVFLIRSALL